VADDHDYQVRGKIVGTMMMQFLAAVRTCIVHLQEGAEDAALTACWTASAKAAPDGLTGAGGQRDAC
jgi:hypothetical protein